MNCDKSYCYVFLRHNLQASIVVVRPAMHAASRHETASLTSLPKDGGVSCFGRSSGRSLIQFLAVHSHA